jgi:cytochrome c553
VRRLLFLGIETTIFIFFGDGALSQPPTLPRAVLAGYCAACHNDSLRTASLSFQSIDPLNVGAAAAVWEKVLRKLKNGEMPPPGLPRPDASETDSLTQWIEASLDKAAADHPRPGGIPIHRLNRTEYANVVRDLLDINVDSVSMLPADDTAYGFDNIAGALPLSSWQLERYLTVASLLTSQLSGLAAKGEASRVFVCRPVAAVDGVPCARSIFAVLARRAYRRTVRAADLDPLLALYQQGRREGGFDEGILRGVEAILVSPNFLFRAERTPPGIAPGSAYPIGDFELASRLSFFLWSTMPDDRLLDLAEKDQLSETSVLERETTRMLANSRSGELIRNFAGQWLYLRNLRYATPDPAVYPRFDGALRDAFVRETELFVESILRENRSVVDLLGANYTFVNDRLARFYGIADVKGAEFRRVTLKNPERGGLLADGSILTVTSYDNSTSIARRGKWILENILDAPPPPPPPEVPSLKAKAADGLALTLRERMEAHRADTACAACHLLMDSLGVALENYDGTGAWRSSDESGLPIDASAKMPDGTSLEGLPGLRAWLLAHQDRFVHALTEKLLTYALGRGLEYYDQPTVRSIEREAALNGNRLPALLTAVVKSTPFRMSTAPEKAGPSK